MTVLWEQADRDCKGGLEPYPVAYEVLVFEARVTGYVPDVNGDPVPVYNRIRNRQLTVATSMTVQEPADPAPGEVIGIMEPVTVDVAQNRSDERCE